VHIITFDVEILHIADLFVDKNNEKYECRQYEKNTDAQKNYGHPMDG